MCDSIFRVVVLIFILQFIKISSAYEYSYYSVPGARPGQIEHEQNNQEAPLSASPSPVLSSSHFKIQNGQLNERISQNFGNGFGDVLTQAQQYPPVPVQIISYPNENQRDGAGVQQGHGGHSESHSDSGSGSGYGYGYGQTNHHHEHETVKPYGEGVAMESKEILGGGAILKILLAIFPFLITILFPPILLVVIGLLLIPVIRLKYFEEGEGGRGFSGSSFIGEELQSSIVGSILSSTNKYDSD